ncbi:MAG: hypothetical protein J6Y78_09355 [Paludibacteraceae bacterium]|nr:hypothetical protein [Paludibacteraceae bacterium]
MRCLYSRYGSFSSKEVKDFIHKNLPLDKEFWLQYNSPEEVLEVFNLIFKDINVSFTDKNENQGFEFDIINNGHYDNSENIIQIDVNSYTLWKTAIDDEECYVDVPEEDRYLLSFPYWVEKRLIPTIVHEFVHVYQDSKYHLDLTTKESNKRGWEAWEDYFCDKIEIAARAVEVVEYFFDKDLNFILDNVKNYESTSFYFYNRENHPNEYKYLLKCISDVYYTLHEES